MSRYRIYDNGEIVDAKRKVNFRDDSLIKSRGNPDLVGTVWDFLRRRKPEVHFGACEGGEIIFDLRDPPFLAIANNTYLGRGIGHLRITVVADSELKLAEFERRVVAEKDSGPRFYLDSTNTY